MPPLPVDATVAVIGTGSMGAGIAQVAAVAGHPVLLYDESDAAVERAVSGIAARLDRAVERGRMTAAERDAAAGRLKRCPKLADIASAKLVVEAVVEDLAAKRSLFAAMEAVVGEDAILASNTSSLSITAIAAGLARPGNVVGMHFFNPAPVLRLVEVISGFATTAATAETVFETAKAWGKTPVHASSTPGFIVNRVARPFYGEGFRLVGEGVADFATIDAVIREAGGFPMGPFQLIDLVGVDVNFAVTKSVYEAFFHDPRYTPSLIQQAYVDAGRFGRKTGHGFYDYADGATPPEPATVPQAPAPHAVVIEGDLGPAEPLVVAIERAGIAVSRHRPAPGTPPGILLDQAVLRLTDGRTAAEAGSGEVRPLVLFDLALDYERCTRIALAADDLAGPEPVRAAAGLFQAAGKAVSVIDDAPAMIVMRTVCMLANEAADAVHKRVCDAAAVDSAMRLGVNYPRGPLAWADHLGADGVCRVLDNLARDFGEDRYRASPLLRRMARSGRRFHA